MKSALVSPPRLCALPSQDLFPTVSQADSGASVFCELPVKLGVLSLQLCLLPRPLPAAASAPRHTVTPSEHYHLWGKLHSSLHSALHTHARCPRTSTWVVSGLEISTPGPWPSACPCFGAVQSNVFPCSAQGSTPSLVQLCSKLTLHAHCLLSAGGQQGQLSQAELFLVTQPTFGCSAPARCRWLHSGIMSSSHTRAAIIILSH